ncbi:class I mannose-6-phosphate isomerase [uncultured Vagococcus sp.]|uniref:class I mannose-6-phosphate isomerase n=1 Tax=uncultured Vagococcus sp. TaxID=189676 RepID=UPI00258B63AB|nr:class I mannose-6-phosphate isomerase [uncultured Vagococcus sp.]
MNYNLRPSVKINKKINSYTNYTDIISRLKQEIEDKKVQVLTIETYPGVDEKELVDSLISKLEPNFLIHSSEILVSEEKMDEMIAYHLTEDRVFGIMSHHKISDFVDEKKQKEVEEKIDLAKQQNQLVICLGVGASLVTKSDLLIYADLSRWEIQTRLKSGEINNWHATNTLEDINRILKRCYFFEWQVADKEKKQVLSKADYLLDTHKKNQPVMISVKDYLEGLKEIAHQPFSLVPFFDPGIWGGHWMQETFDIRKDEVNLAWSFNGVPEENSLLLNFDDVYFETPGNNLLFFYGKETLGDRVFGQFGNEFPIRFNFLDTVGGQNLSLQVHPQLSYVQETFGAHYTQDESYYILHAEEEANVYLGFKNGTKKEEVLEALKKAESGETSFDDNRYIYQQPVKKHDHYLIPAGTIHSSGAGSVVLEISSTPNRFTFKLWDWERVDLDGKPRSVHLEHGSQNLVLERDEDWVKSELINQFEVVAKGEGWVEEKTGLHEMEFIETRRHWFTEKVIHENFNSVNVLNLVEGEEVTVESLTNEFEPFVVHYAQTFIIPETIKNYTIRPSGKSEGQECITMKAFIR